MENRGKSDTSSWGSKLTNTERGTFGKTTALFVVKVNVKEKKEERERVGGGGKKCIATEMILELDYRVTRYKKCKRDCYKNTETSN